MKWFKTRKRKREIEKRKEQITKELDKMSMYLYDNPNICFKKYDKMRGPLFTEWFELERELRSL